MDNLANSRTEAFQVESMLGTNEPLVNQVRQNSLLNMHKNTWRWADPKTMRVKDDFPRLKESDEIDTEMRGTFLLAVLKTANGSYIVDASNCQSCRPGWESKNNNSYTYKVDNYRGRVKALFHNTEEVIVYCRENNLPLPAYIVSKN